MKRPLPPLFEPAKKIAEALSPLSSGKLAQEILNIDAETVALCVEVDGVDYILSMQRIPKQRAKPTTQ